MGKLLLGRLPRWPQGVRGPSTYLPRFVSLSVTVMYSGRCSQYHCQNIAERGRRAVLGKEICLAPLAWLLSRVFLLRHQKIFKAGRGVGFQTAGRWLGEIQGSPLLFLDLPLRLSCSTRR